MPESSDPPPLPRERKPIQAELVDERKGRQSDARSRGSDESEAEIRTFVPTLRWKENLYQAAVMAVVGLIGAGIGAVVGRVYIPDPNIQSRLLYGALIGGVGGAFLGAFLSGFVLMILGIQRGKRK